MTAVASRKDPGRTMSGVGGTGSGTGLVGLGFGVGPDTTAGKLLMLVAPATSIVVGGGLFYLHVSVNRWMETRAAGSARATLERRSPRKTRRRNSASSSQNSRRGSSPANSNAWRRWVRCRRRAARRRAAGRRCGSRLGARPGVPRQPATGPTTASTTCMRESDPGSCGRWSRGSTSSSCTIRRWAASTTTWN
jgi:hypothetical protein